MVSDSGLAGRVHRAGTLQLSITGRSFHYSTRWSWHCSASVHWKAAWRWRNAASCGPRCPRVTTRSSAIASRWTADQRQRDAIHLVFRKFRELGSIRQVFFWFQRHSVELPVRTFPGKACSGGCRPRRGGSPRF